MKNDDPYEKDFRNTDVLFCRDVKWMSSFLGKVFY